MTDANDNEETKLRNRNRVVAIVAFLFVGIVLIVGLSVGLSGRNNSSGSAPSVEGRPFESTDTTVLPTSSPNLIPTESPISSSPTHVPTAIASLEPSISAAPSISDIPSQVPTFRVTTKSDFPTPAPTILPTPFTFRQQWATSGNGISLKIHNAMSQRWQDTLRQVLTDWERGTPDAIQFIRTQVPVDPGCTPINGVIKLCNSDKGANNGNRGFNTVLLDGNGKITGVTVEMNDFFITSERFMKYFLCQFIGRALGLQASDEDYFNTPIGSCMDYSNDISSDDMLTPSKADFERLVAFYGTFSRRQLRHQ